MADQNPLLLTEAEKFTIGESDFRYFLNSQPHRCESGAILFCSAGSAHIIINLQPFTLEHNSMAMLLPGTVLSMEQLSEDFALSFFAFSRDLFDDVVFRFDPSFLHFLVEHPSYTCDAKSARGAQIWFQNAAYTYEDRENRFRNMIIRNRLQNIFLELYDKLRRNMEHSAGSPPRRVELFQQFASRVHDHCTERREVAFYANELCISSRYLSAIVREVAECSAKEVIDRAVVQEIKILLQSSGLSVQEIAYRLHFPDQSYLGRFFKRHMGLSPTDYRLQHYNI